MREFELLDTACLSILLMLALVLPLMLTFRPPLDETLRKKCMRIVWTGQALLAAAGVLVLASSLLVPLATLLGALSIVFCALKLQRMTRLANRANSAV